MTTGIYAIFFENLDKIYIGQSTNIEGRFVTHKSLFKKGHTNYKLARAFEKEPSPVFSILEVCTSGQLDSKEIDLIAEFDSIYSGLNIAAGGEGGTRGVNSGKSIYSEAQLKYAFELLADPKITIAKVVELSGVSRAVIGQICAKERHIWLHEQYPEISKLVINNKHNRFVSAQENRYKTNAILVSPNGEEYMVTNRNQFAKQHNLNSGHLGSVIRGQVPQHKGWKLKKGVSDE